MDFKLHKHVPRDSPDMTLQKFFQKGAWPGSRDPLNFSALNANSSKKIKATDFKFDTRVSRDSLDVTLKIFILLLTYIVTKMRLNYYSVKIHLAEIWTLMSAF